MRPAVEFAKICTRTEASFHFAVDNQRVSIGFQLVECHRELLEFIERCRAQLVARPAVKCKLDHSALELPRQLLAFVLFYAQSHPFRGQPTPPVSRGTCFQSRPASAWQSGRVSAFHWQ